jgi:O-antigen/teichoic acid export membrane protein
VKPGDEIRQRAVAGVAIVGMRNVVIRVLALGGMVILARLLAPRDFGVFALALAFTSFAALFADAGIGAALIGSEKRPEKPVLEALFGFQLLSMALIAAAIALVAWPFGEVGKVTAVMAAALPLGTFRTPGALVLERELEYRRLATVEVCEALAFYGWTIATVASGWGVWGLATGAVVRSGTGSAVMVLSAPVGLLRPRLALGRVRPLIGFGAGYQTNAIATVVRDQGFNLAVGAIGGVVALGIWSLGSRLLQVPSLLFAPVWRVSYPAFSRLLAGGEQAAPLIERGLALLAIGAGALLAVLVGSAQALVPVAFGPQWESVNAVLPGAALGFMVAGPLSTVAAGYLYAVGDSFAVLRAVLLNGAALAAITFTLLPLLGVAAIGLGWLAAGVVEAFVLGRVLARRTGASIFPHLAVPTAAAAFAAAAGWALASSAGETVDSLILSALLAASLYFAVLGLVRRRHLADAFLVAGRALRASLAVR